MKKVVLSLVGICSAAYGQTLPDSTNPGLVRQQIQQETPRNNVKSVAQPSASAEKSWTIPERYKNIKFFFPGLSVSGMTVFQAEQIKPLYQDHLDQIISLYQLYQLRNQLNLRYYQQGYFLAQVVVVPQKLCKQKQACDHLVEFKVLEGDIHHATIHGETSHNREQVQAYGQNIVRNKPAQIAVLEKNILLMNELPGQSVRAVLKPDSEVIGSAELLLQSEFKKTNGYFVINNRGTDFIGPTQVVLGTEINSLFGADRLGLQASSVMTEPKEMGYAQVSYDRVLNDNGLMASITASVIKTAPNASLSELDIHGKSESFDLKLSYPFLLLRQQSLLAFLKFNWQNSRNETRASEQQTQDRVRSVGLGIDYRLFSSWGRSELSASVTQGLTLFGASQNNNPNSSRLGTDYKFTRLNLDLSHLYPFGQGFSLLGRVKGQYAFSQLPAVAELGFGGPVFGRGYDASRITGDRGLMAGLELRYQFFNLLEEMIASLQPFVFYDIGVLWMQNVQNRALEFQNNGGRMSASSAGAGLRLFFKNNIYATVEYAKPLTLETAKHGQDGRVFFSVVGRF